MPILRYDHMEGINSKLDPIEDLLNLITAFKSKEFTSDILREKFGFTTVAEINRTRTLIALHIEVGINLATQAFEGSSDISYLPLYYSTLNFTKVYLLLLGKRAELERNRWHGAVYRESEMVKSFLKEQIEIRPSGTIPLIYKTLSGSSIAKKGLKIPLHDLYSHIQSVSAEFTTITKEQTKLLYHSANFVQDDANGHYIRINLTNNYSIEHPPKPRTIKAYKRIKLVTSPDEAPYYASQKLKLDFDSAKQRLLRSVRRDLLSDIQNPNNYLQWFSYTPITGKKHVFNEELSIMLAFFHLSNVVRYNPEHLDKIRDSKYWVLLLALRKHGFLQFIKLMWGNYNRFSFDLH